MPSMSVPRCGVRVEDVGPLGELFRTTAAYSSRSACARSIVHEASVYAFAASRRR